MGVLISSLAVIREQYGGTLVVQRRPDHQLKRETRSQKAGKPGKEVHKAQSTRLEVEDLGETWGEDGGKRWETLGFQLPVRTGARASPTHWQAYFKAR